MLCALSLGYYQLLIALCCQQGHIVHTSYFLGNELTLATYYFLRPFSTYMSE